MHDDDLYLAHYGIKGMKWGVRRYRNEDGSLTEAGKKRYDYDEAVNSAKQKVNDAKAVYKKAQGTDKDKANLELQYAREDLRSTKIKNKIDANGGLTKTQEKYKKEYMKKGMNEEEAAVAAYKRDIAKKALMVGAGVAVAAVGTYAAYKYGQNNFDKIIPKGTDLSRITSNGDKSVKDAFYATLSKNKLDSTKYRGMYAKQLTEGNILAGIAPTNKSAYKKTIKVAEDMKIASPKNAASIMGNALKNSNITKDSNEYKELRKMLVQERALMPTHSKLMGNAIKELDDFVKDGKVGKNLYEAMNVNLMNHDHAITKNFYSELKKAGYSGVKDINDAKYSGYATKLPLIIADSSKVKVTDAVKLSDSEIKKANAVATGALMSGQLAKSLGIYGTVGAAAYGAGKATQNAQRNAMVEQYRNEHPNTKMSYNEIVRMYERSYT